MSIVYEERLSDSPYIETITHGYTASNGASIRPAEVHWHMVFVREQGRVHPLVVGPLKTSGVASWQEGAEILWIKFKLGTFMPYLPVTQSLDSETALPKASSQSFWLNGCSWQFPDFENVEIFVKRLVRREVLLCDPIIKAVLQGQPQEVAPRTVRHRFLQATGLTQNHIQQFQRAQRATILLQQGFSILDTVYELGYYDQPHLTRSLKRFMGTTPGQVVGRSDQPE